MIRHIPNAFTLLNLFSGSIGVFACANGDYKLVPISIFISLVADFLDGNFAKILNVRSELGGQLDSLADMVSFGVLPGVMLVQLLSMSNMPAYGSYTVNPLAYIGFIYTIFACIRLAKFNLDSRQTDSFIGLATPAAAVFVLGLYLYFFSQDYSMLPTMTQKMIFQTPTLLAVIGILSYLMVSEIPMFSFKGGIFKWKGNQIKVVFIVVSLFVLAKLRELGLSLIVVFYILASVIDYQAWKYRTSKS